MEAPKLEFTSQTNKEHDAEKKSNQLNNWSKQQSAHLLQLVKQHGRDWKQISEQMELFTPKTCLDKYMELQSNWTEGEWTDSENCELEQSIIKGNRSNWCMCSVLVGTRSPENCKDRWELKEETDLENRPWGDQEQVLIFEKMQKHGVAWKTIAGELWKRDMKFLGNLVHNEIRKIKVSKFGGLFQAITMDWTLHAKSSLFSKIAHLIFRTKRRNEKQRFSGSSQKNKEALQREER